VFVCFAVSFVGHLAFEAAVKRELLLLLLLLLFIVKVTLKVSKSSQSTCSACITKTHVLLHSVVICIL
jgi:hypothetical protein